MRPLRFAVNPLPIAKWGERAQGGVGEPATEGTGRPEGLPAQARPLKEAREGDTHKKAALRGCALRLVRSPNLVAVVSATISG